MSVLTWLHDRLANLAWTTSGHTGAASKVAGFGATGEAVEKTAGTDYSPAVATQDAAPSTPVNGQIWLDTDAAPAMATGPIVSSGLTMATAKVLGRATAGAGAIEELSTLPAIDGSGLTEIGRLPTRNATQKTSSFTAAKNQLYSITLAANAAIAVTFPATPAAGDRFGYRIEVAHSAHTYASKPVTGTRCCGSTDDTVNGKWWLFIAGEQLVWEYDGATWWPVVDGRIPHVAALYKSTNQTTNSAGVYTRMPYDTVIVDNAHLTTTGESAVITIRRVGDYRASYGAGNVTALALGSFYSRILAGAQQFGRMQMLIANGNVSTHVAPLMLSQPAGTAIQGQFASDQANYGSLGAVEYALGIVEVLR